MGEDAYWTSPWKYQGGGWSNESGARLGLQIYIRKSSPLGQGELTEGKADRETGSARPPQHRTVGGWAGDEQVKKLAEKRQVKGRSRTESPGDHESQEGHCFPTLLRASAGVGNVKVGHEGPRWSERGGFRLGRLQRRPQTLASLREACARRQVNTPLPSPTMFCHEEQSAGLRRRAQLPGILAQAPESPEDS